eukprot:3616127-Amphidinium_carterae.1
MAPPCNSADRGARLPQPCNAGCRPVFAAQRSRAMADSTSAAASSVRCVRKAMPLTPTGPVGATPSGAAPVPGASSSARVLPPAPATHTAATLPPPIPHGPPAPQETTPTRKRHHDNARPPPQVLCAPINTSQGPSQDVVPAALHAAATPP